MHRHRDPGGRRKGRESGREEDRGRERDRYNESDKNRASQRGRDSDREYKRPSKPFNHVAELNKQILSSSDTRALFRGRDGPDRQTDRGKHRDDERGRERERYNERERTRHRELGRDRERGIDRERGGDRDRQCTLTQRPSKQYNIELNKQIMRISDTKELCDLICKHAAEFDHVNVATALRKVLQNRRGRGDGTDQHALDTLEKLAMTNMEAFRPREIANILHIMAKRRYKSTLWSDLERRAEAIAGEFDSKGIANTLWAYATMGTKPGERMMGKLEGRAEAISGEFKPQDVAKDRKSVV